MHTAVVLQNVAKIVCDPSLVVKQAIKTIYETLQTRSKGLNKYLAQVEQKLCINQYYKALLQYRIEDD